MRTIVKNEVSGKEYLVSSTYTWDAGLETMVFAYDSTREDVMSWSEMYVEHYTDLEDMSDDHARVVNILAHEELHIDEYGYIDNLIMRA